MADSTTFYSDPTQTPGVISDEYSGYAQYTLDVEQRPETSGTGSILDYKARSSDIFSSKEYNVSNLSYPSDLMGADNEYGGNFVIFYINTQNDSKVNVSGGENIESDYVSDTASKDSSGLSSAMSRESNSDAGNTAVGGLITGGALKGAAGAVATGNFKGAVTEATKLAAVTDTWLKDAGSKTKSTKRLKAAIALHTPNNINVTYAASWEGEDTAKEQLMALRSGSVGSVATIMQQLGVTKGKHEILGAGGLGSMISKQTHQAANSKKEMMFKGVDFRSFQFEYNFAPRSTQELKQVQDIIKMFKFHMHPEYVSGTGQYLYVYPSEFDILYYNDGGESRHLPRYTSCVLESMSVNHTPNDNFTAFGGNTPSAGAPTEIRITMQFKELATLSKAEIADGY